MINKLSNKKRYEVADKLADAFAPVLGNNFCSLNSHVQFGIVLNQKFNSNGKVQSLNERYSFDIASHVTNLILRRLCRTNSVVDVDL